MAFLQLYLSNQHAVSSNPHHPHPHHLPFYHCKIKKKSGHCPDKQTGRDWLHVEYNELQYYLLVGLLSPPLARIGFFSFSSPCFRIASFSNSARCKYSKNLFFTVSFALGFFSSLNEQIASTKSTSYSAWQCTRLPFGK